MLKFRGQFLDFLKGDLFATTASFGAQVVIRLGSSLILTRILKPEAYGIVAIVYSISYVVALLADIAVTVSLVRHQYGDQPDYLNTAWTLRLGRSLLNAILMFSAAPLLADLYHAPLLTLPLRIFSVWFVLEGFESMSFPLAIRRRNSRIIVYTDLIANAVTTMFTLAYCYVTRDYMGMVYGMLLNRLLVTVMSYGFYRDVRPRLMVNREAARELLRYTRYAVPSSFITLVLNTFDKMIFLRLFDLRLLGVFSLAGNIASPIDALIWRISELVLYPRCAHDFRADPAAYPLRYYTHNTGVFLSVLTLPAVVGGAAPLLIALLYDPRYAQAGMILQGLMLRTALLALASPAEHMLIAAGQLQVQLNGNIFRTIFMVVGTVGGFYLAGFTGFLYGIALSGLAPLLYYLWLQGRKGFLLARYELYKVIFLLVTFALSYLASSLLLNLLPVRSRI